MNKFLISFFICLIFISPISGQKDSIKNNHQFVSLNTGFLLVAISGGLHYEVGLKNPKWVFRTGLNYYAHVYGEGGDGISFHVGFIYKFKHIELSFGFASIDKDVIPWGVVPSLFIAYRTMFNYDKIMLRAGIGLVEFVHIGLGFRI